MKKMTPIKAIRSKCLDCCTGQVTEVRQCPVTECPLYPFRMGHNPNIKRKYTQEQKAEMAERLRKARETKSTP